MLLQQVHRQRLLWIGALALIIGGYLLSRLWQNRNTPLFIDEGVYLWFAESVLHGDLVRGFGEGKPLIGWIIAIPLALGIDPIWSARLPHLLAGMGGLCAATALAMTLSGRAAALTTAFLCLIFPSLLFHERMATPDIFMGALGTLSLWLALHAYRHQYWGWVFASGFALILTVLAKSPVGFFFYLGPLLFFWAESVNGKHPPWRWLALLYALPLIFAAIVVILVATRLHAGAYPPGFGLHEIFAKTRGNADLLERAQQNLAILTAWLRQSGNWLFTAIFIVSGVMAVGRRRSHLIVLAALVILWFSAMLFTATFLPERYWTPALYIAAIVVGWGVAEAATAISQWDGAHFACRKAVFAGITGAVMLVFAILMLPSDHSIITINSRDLEQNRLEGLSAAADYLTDHFPYEDAQVVLLHGGDYTRLKAYLPHDLTGRVRQVHLVNRQSQDIIAQMVYLAEWSNDTAVTYVVVESAANFGAAWQTSFPLARRVAEFAIPDSDYPTQIWRLAQVH